MKHLKIAGLCLASMLVMGMALAGNASAALLWLVCLEGTGLTKYTNSKCLTASGGASSEKSWQSLGVPTGTTITVKILAFSILLSDLKAPIVGNVSVRCGMEGSIGEGTIESGGKGTVTKAEYVNTGVTCSGETNCEKVEKVVGAHLPWATEIFTTEGKQLTKIKSKNPGAGKEPGWEVECKVDGIAGNKDTCENESGKEEQVILKNSVQTELLVAGLFAESNKATCEKGGAKSGLVKGLIAILLPGGALSINPE